MNGIPDTVGIPEDVFYADDSDLVYCPGPILKRTQGQQSGPEQPGPEINPWLIIGAVVLAAMVFGGRNK